MKLRDYQDYLFNKTLECVSLDKNPVVCIPTGTGKGNILCETLRYYLSQNKRILVVVPTKFLATNISDRLPDLVNKISFLGSGLPKYNPAKPITIGIFLSVNSKLKRDRTARNYDIVLHDEVHLALSKSWSSIFDLLPDSVHIGYTATPKRLDNRPLDKHFTDLLIYKPTQWFIDSGYLSKFRIKTKRVALQLTGSTDALDQQNAQLNKTELVADIVDTWNNEVYSKRPYLPTIVFATTVDHCDHLTQRFNDFLGYEGFKSVHSLQSSDYNDRAIAEIRSGKLLGLVNVQMITLGVDIPELSCVILARFTKSFPLYLQMVGRILRPSDNVGLILDHAGNVIEHGSPAFPYDWSLSATEDNTAKAKCNNCLTPLISFQNVIMAYPDSLTVKCDVCGYVNVFQHMPETKKQDPTKSKKRPIEIDGKLIDFDLDPVLWTAYKIANKRKGLSAKAIEMHKTFSDKADLSRALDILGLSTRQKQRYLLY